jgi:hypothetical protein
MYVRKRGNTIMEKTYTQKVHYRIILEGDYSVCNLLEEELHGNAEEMHDIVWEYVADNIIDYYPPKITLDNLRTEEEK